MIDPIAMLWQNALTAIPLALAIAAVCRWVPCRPATRHLLWTILLLWLLLPPGATGLLGRSLTDSLDVLASHEEPLAQRAEPADANEPPEPRADAEPARTETSSGALRPDAADAAPAQTRSTRSSLRSSPRERTHRPPVLGATPPPVLASPPIEDDLIVRMALERARALQRRQAPAPRTSLGFPRGAVAPEAAGAARPRASRRSQRAPGLAEDAHETFTPRDDIGARQTVSPTPRAARRQARSLEQRAAGDAEPRVHSWFPASPKRAQVYGPTPASPDAQPAAPSAESNPSQARGPSPSPEAASSRLRQRQPEPREQPSPGRAHDEPASETAGADTPAPSKPDPATPRTTADAAPGADAPVGWSLSPSLVDRLGAWGADLIDRDDLVAWGAHLRVLRDDFLALPPAPRSVWISGAAAIALILGARIALAARLLRRCNPALEDVQEQVRAASASFGLRRPPRTLLSPDRLSPMIWCGLRPRLVLPASLWEDLDDVGRSAVIHHELAHLRRKDHWVRWAQLAAIAAYWWHPVVWWASRRLEEEADLCCDAWVTALMPGNRRAYAQALLSTKQFIDASNSQSSALSLGVTTAGAKRFARRLTMVMTTKNKPHVSIAGALLAACVLTMGSVGSPLLACPPDKEEKTKARHAAHEHGKHKHHAKPAEPDRPDEPSKAPEADEPDKDLSTFERYLRERNLDADAPSAEHSDRVQRLEERMSRLMERLQQVQRRRAETAARLSARAGRLAAPPRPGGDCESRSDAPSASFFRFEPGRGISVQGLPGEQVWRRYELPDDQLEKMFDLMKRDDVPVLIRPEDDAIEVRATPADHAIFAAFVGMIDGKQERVAYVLSSGKLEALTDLMALRSVPVLVRPGSRSLTVIGGAAQQRIFAAFARLIDPEGFGQTEKGRKAAPSAPSGRAFFGAPDRPAPPAPPAALREQIQNLRSLQGLEGRAKLEALRELEGLKGLKGLEALRGLEALEDMEFDFDFDFDVDVEALEERLGMAASKRALDVLMERRAMLEQQAEQLRRRAEQIEQQAETLAEQAEQMREQADDHEEQDEQSQGQEARVSDAERYERLARASFMQKEAERLARESDRLFEEGERLEEQGDRVDEQAERIIEQMHHAEERFESLEEVVAERVEALEDQIGEMESTIEEQMEQIDEQVAQWLESVEEEIEANLDAIEEDVRERLTAELSEV